MLIDVGKRRHEVIVILITALIIAFLVSLLSNVIFTLVYNDNLSLLLIVIGILLVVFTTLAYFILVLQVEKGTARAKFPITLHKGKQEFIDIPLCPPSVHARFLFNNLPLDIRNNITNFENSNIKEFFKSEIILFIDEVIQEYILAIIINNCFFHQSEFNTIPLDQLPSGIRNNKCLKQRAERGWQLKIDKDLSIESIGLDNRFIRLNSNFGKIEFYWSIAYTQGNNITNPVLPLSQIDNEDECLDFEIELIMSYQCSFMKMFSKRLESFTNWIKIFEKSLKDIDWHKYETRLALSLLKETVDNIKKIEAKDLHE